MYIIANFFIYLQKRIRIDDIFIDINTKTTVMQQKIDVRKTMENNTNKRHLVQEHIQSHIIRKEVSNGYVFGILDCTGEEYAKQVNAVNIDDIQWVG